MWQELVRQSKRDYPIGSVRNGLLDGTKRKASEFVGDLFILACVGHTSAGEKALAPYLAMQNISVKRFISAITDYLCMITWMHNKNAKSKVNSAGTEVSRVMKEIKRVFPRNSGQGWNIPKFHGMIKMVPYMKLFGSAINFFSGAGESHHKHFVKAPGNQT